MKFSGIRRFGSRGLLKVRKYSPEILVGMGIVGFISATVMACRITASQKAKDILDEHKADMDTINEAAEVVAARTEEEAARLTPYTDKEIRLDKAKTVARTVGKMTLLYWKPITITMVSMTCILGAHTIMKRRNVALIAAYKLVEEAFTSYRDRVKAKLGADADKEFMYDTETLTSERTEIDENGKKIKIKESQQVLKGETVSMYAKLFDENNHQWSRDPNFNWLYLKKKRDYLNDKLHAKGHVFLNEVYEELDFPHTQAGQAVGWVSKGDGDGYISFGPWHESLLQMVNEGVGSSVLLDFNVDGVIWDLI